MNVAADAAAAFAVAAAVAVPFAFALAVAVAVAVAVVDTFRIKDVKAYKAVKITSNCVKSYPFGVPRAMLIIILASDCRKKPQEDLEVDCSGFWR